MKSVRLAIWLLLAIGFLVKSASAADKPPVDLALVLAIDCSGSVDAREMRLQLDGLAAAFRDPDVIAAIGAGAHGRIAVNMMLWADPDEQKLVTGWHVIDSPGASTAFADTAQAFNVRIGGGTGLGVAIGFGITLLNTSPYTPSRRVIDVSGDGRESWELREPRFKLADAQALRRGTDIIVNGLAIANDIPQLPAYYRANVAGGVGSFVIEAKSYDDFAQAMRIKLLREILPNIAALDFPHVLHRNN